MVLIFENQEHESGKIQQLNKLKIFFAKFNTKACKEKIDDNVNTNDIAHVFRYRTLNKSPIKINNKR